jgi:uncharacterized C2H2 Zn-finger protein
MEQIERIGSDTRHHRGLGDVGTVVDHVDMSDTTFGGCPRCNESEMILSKDLGVGAVDVVAYCTNLKCPHFVQDAVEHDMNRIRANKPEVWDNTAECPECGTRFTTQLRRHMARQHKYVTGNATDGGIVGDVLCDECSPSLVESTDLNDTEIKEEL